MKILIVTQDSFLVNTRTRYSEIYRDRFLHFRYHLKIDDWADFIDYVKNYKIKENEK